MDKKHKWQTLNRRADIVSHMPAPALMQTGVHKCPSSNFAPEFGLLIACCRPDLCASWLASALNSPLNWDRVLRLAEHQHVLPALAASICGRNDVPGSIQSAVRQRSRNNELKVLRFSAELARIAAQFADHGIHVLSHKGPALGKLLYGDPAMRQFGDLDLLVCPRDVPRAKAALQELGFETPFQLSPRQERAYLRSGYEYVFGTSAEPNLVELQWQIVPRFYSIAFNMKALFERSASTEVEGFRLRTLGKEDLMLVLCVHAAKHEWAQLGMLRDIAALAQPNLDWQWIEYEAQRLGILQILTISLLLCHDLLNLNLPAK